MSLWSSLKQPWPVKKADGTRGVGCLALAVGAVVFTTPALVAGLTFAAPGRKGGPEGEVFLWLSLALLFTGACWLGLWMTHRLLGHLFSSALFGEGPGPRLIAALLVFLLYPQLAAKVIVPWASAVLQLGFKVPLDLVGAGLSMKHGDTAQPSGEQTLAMLLLRFLYAATERVAQVSADFWATLPFADFVMALAAWAMLAVALNYLWCKGIIEQVITGIVSRRSFNWTNIGFVAILSSGTFLSLAALTSLPRLRQVDEPNSEVTLEKLDAVLLNLRTPPDRLDRFVASLARDPFSSPSPPVAAAPTAPGAEPPVPGAQIDAGTPTDKKPATPSAPAVERSAKEVAPNEVAEEERKAIRAYIDTANANLRAQYPEIAAKAQSLRSDILSEESRAVSAAKSGYALKNYGRRGSREEAIHFLGIQNWFDAMTKANQERMRVCSEFALNSQNQVGTWLRTSKYLEESANASSTEATWQHLGTGVPWLDPHALDAACRVPVSRPMPEPAELGESLGALKFVAGWLLNAGSIPLALIVGTLGFGLLGAVISTFVKERTERAHDDDKAEIVSDLAGVVLRGFSAAIVVFLAAQGGLAVLAAGSGEPNPYVLLLACFVAAVYSERIWGAAQDYLVSQLDRHRNGPDPDPAADKGASEQPAEELRKEDEEEEKKGEAQEQEAAKGGTAKAADAEGSGTIDDAAAETLETPRSDDDQPPK
jgi:hypothetical protein